MTDAPILWQNALINFLYIMYFAVEKKAFLWYNTCIYVIKDRESLVFSDIFFLYVFLPLFLICYFAARNTKLKNAVLIVFSLFFYAWGEPVWVGLLIFSSVFDFLNGRFIDKHKDEKIAVLGAGPIGILLAQSAKALGAAQAAGADIGISVTGVAGPTGGDALRPVGTVYLGAARGETVYVKKLSVSRPDRALVRARAAQAALELALRLAQGKVPAGTEPLARDAQHSAEALDKLNEVFLGH